MTDSTEKIVYVNRTGTDCRKWDGAQEQFGREGLLPMWIADMDFQSPRCVIEALAAKVQGGVYGYDMPPKEYYRSFMDWQKRRHGLELKQDWLRFAPGLVPALNWCVQMYTQPGDGVVLLTPVYYPMLNAVKNNGRALLCCNLIDHDGEYSIDMERLSQVFETEKPRMFILCSPHNPCGRVWKRDELIALLELCRRHKVLVVADEIHQDIIMPGHKHIPVGTIEGYGNMVITMTAPSKTFNLAGLQNSVIVIADPALREIFDRFTTNIRVTYGNSLGYVAATAAWQGGEAWLENVKKIIWDNYLLFREKLESAFPKLKISPLEGTYLVWVDFSAYVGPEMLESFLLDICGVAADMGGWFGGKETCFGRFNVATCRANVELAAARIIDALKDAES